MFPAMLDQVRRIPRGKVATYGDVAEASGHPGCARQVVWALRTAEGVPWHRVLGAKGHIRLPGEAALEQILRLRLEGVEISNKRVDLALYHHKFRPDKQPNP